MPRILKADLLAENERLRMQIAEYQSKRGERSRSPRRAAASAARTRAVLNQVCHFDRDAVLQEQRETIQKQQTLIQDLRNGEGAYGDVLLAIRQRDYPELLDDFVRQRCQDARIPVNQVLRKIEEANTLSLDFLRWGSSYLERRIR